MPEKMKARQYMGGYIFFKYNAEMNGSLQRGRILEDA